MKLYSAPKYFNHNKIIDFLEKSEDIFSIKEQRIPNVIFDLSKVKRSSVTSLLIIYKFIDYTYHNYCFKAPRIDISQHIEDSWNKYDFTDLMEAYIAEDNNTEKQYKKLKVRTDGRFIIAPHALLRNSNYSEEKLQKVFLPKIEQYYSKSPKAATMIFTCLSELLLNFWEHATQDTKSIIIANGDSKRIEIACVDTGEGIVSTLGKSHRLKNLSPEDILRLSLSKGSTSKKLTNHMGYGLWLINEIVNLTKSRLHIYSQGAYIKNDYGTIKTGKCGYWQGTIVTLILYLEDPKTICDLENQFERKKLDTLKINFL